MKKIICGILSAACMITMLSACGTNTDVDISDVPADNAVTPAEFNIASLKGPTTMGMVKLMEDSDNGETANKYNVTIYGTADEIVTGIVSGTVDVANVPANLSSVLYKKTEGEIKVCAVNTLGVLYMVETGESIYTIDDLKGKTIYSTGKGTTPEYVLNYILTKNGINPETDVNIEYKSESTEVAAILAESENAIALLPQPFVAVASMKNDNIRICLDMTKEWDNVSESTLCTGVVIARSSFIDENPTAFNLFLSEYQASTEYVNANNEVAADLIEKFDIVNKQPALAALPYCNITFLKGDEMRATVHNYLSVLFEQDPVSVGGALPDENFYYNAK